VKKKKELLYRLVEEDIQKSINTMKQDLSWIKVRIHSAIVVYDSYFWLHFQFRNKLNAAELWGQQ
jgi:hypothetical protein